MSCCSGGICYEFSTRTIRLASLVHVVPLASVPTGADVVPPLPVEVLRVEDARTGASRVVARDLAGASTPSVAERARGRLVFPVSRADNGALEVLVLAPGWAVGQLHWREVVPPAKAFGPPGRRIPTHLALPRRRGI